MGSQGVWDHKGGRDRSPCLAFCSVYPTRTARFGVALVPSGVLKLKNAAFAKDFRQGEGWGGATHGLWLGFAFEHTEHMAEHKARSTAQSTKHREHMAGDETNLLS